MILVENKINPALPNSKREKTEPNSNVFLKIKMTPKFEKKKPLKPQI